MTRPPSLAAILNEQKIAQAKFTFDCQKCKSDDINFRGTGKARCLHCGHEWNWQPVSAQDADVDAVAQTAPPAQRTRKRKSNHQPSPTTQRLEKAQQVREWLDQLPDQPEDYEPMVSTKIEDTLILPKRRKRTEEEDEQRLESSSNSTQPSSPPTLDTLAPMKPYPQRLLSPPASNPPASSLSLSSSSVQRFSFNTTSKKVSSPAHPSLDTRIKATSALGVPTSSRPCLAYLQPNILHPNAITEITKFPLRSKLNHAPRVPSPLTADATPKTMAATDENNDSQHQQRSLTELSTRIRQQRAALFLRTGASLR